MLQSLHPKWYATFLENWPVEMNELAPERVAIDIPPDVLDWMILHIGHLSFQPPRGAPPLDEGFRASIEEAVSVFNAPCFVRTGVCSFKRPGEPLEPLQDADAIISLISTKNHNVETVLRDCREIGYSLALHISAWRDIPAWSEFRLFIRDLKIIGASQYHHQIKFPEIETHYTEIASGLSSFVKRLLPRLHLNDVVVDVSVLPDEQGGFEATLIEVNPLIVRTDPCLFTWNRGGDFDGSLRCL